MVGWPGPAALGWLAFTLYLLLPTALPLRLDGVPLNQRGELLGLVGLGVVLLLAVIAWLLRLSDARGPHGPLGGSRSGWMPAAALVGATVLLVGLGALKLAFPRSEALRLCLRSPEVDAAGCLWSPEGRVAPDLTRYEDQLAFDETAGRSWRLGYLNSSPEFNLWDQPPETPMGRRESYRRARANPFEASVSLSPRLSALLGDRFADDRGLVHFSGRLRGRLVVTSAAGGPWFASAPERLDQLESFRFTVPRAGLEGLRWTYWSYDCPGEEAEWCAREMVFRTLSHPAAVLEVRVVRPDGPETAPLGYGHLLRLDRNPFARAARWAEALAVALLAGGGVVWPVARALHQALWFLAGLGAWRGLTMASGAVGLSALAYLVIEARLASSRGYATLFDPGASFWLTLPGMALVLLAATRPRWRERLGAGAAGPSSRSGLLLWVLPFCAYVLILTATLAPQTDEATPWWPGDDNLAGASRGREVLREAALSGDFAVIAKPAFPYLRAAGYLVLGEGERFTSIAVGIAFLLVYAIVTYGGLHTCLAAIARGSAPARWCAVALYVATALWLANAYLGYGANFAANLFTEGPAWLAFMLSAALVLRATGDGLDPRLVAGVGVTLTIAVLCRATLVGHVPLFAAALLTTEPIDRRAAGVVVRGVVVPLALALAAMVGHATIIGAWGDTGWYLAANSRIRPGMSLAGLFGEPLHRLVPTRQAGAQIALVAVLYLAALARTRRRHGAWAAPPVLRLLAFGGTLLLFGFVAQLPILPAPYYPRTIMPTYFFLLALLPMWIDRLTRPGATA
jgi:hypothetical protein